MRKVYRTLMTLLVGLTVLTSCNKEMFDQKIYDEIVNTTFPIEPVDATHTWTTTTRRSIVVNVNGKLGEMEKLQVLTADPSSSSSTPQIMAEEKNPVEGRSYTMLYIAPVAQTTFYAAIRTIDGKYAVVPFEATAQQINFTDKSIVNAADVTKWQEFTYIFEENFPEPGDYDFNDCVMRISMQPGNKKNQVKVNVTLAAVGAKATIAGAIKLLNYTANDIESIEVEDGSAFDDGYPIPLKAFSSGDTFLTGQNGSDAVIRLFEDAMWCLTREDASDAGYIHRIKVNVTTEENDDNKLIDPITKTFVITFKEGSAAMLNNFLLDNLDPFIIVNYNGNFWETHTYNHRLAKVLYDYYYQTTLPMIWALCVPTGTFRWPLESHLIGNYKDGVLTGAYREYGHSFGQWAADKTQSTDWYFYPTLSATIYK